MHKIAFQLGEFTIYWYGVFLAVGFVAGLWTASRRALNSGIAAEKILDVGPWLIVGTIIGARLLYVVSYWQRDFAGKPFWEIFMIRHGGLVYYGGLIGAIVFKLMQDWLANITPQYWQFWLGLVLVVIVLIGRERMGRWGSPLRTFFDRFARR